MRSKMAKLKNRHKHKGFRFSVKQWNKKIGRKFVTIRDLAITLLLDAVYAPVGEHSVVATE